MFNKLVKLGKKAVVSHRIKSIESRDFSIIASNCTGTLPYRFIDMPHLSPTVNLFFFAPCYMKFITRMDYYLDQPLRFVNSSAYPRGRSTHRQFGQYPIAKLDDIEIHFMHYDSVDDAEEKWNRRKLRINRKRLIFTFTDRDLCTTELMQAFDNLPGKKLLLTARVCPWISCAVTVPAYRGQSEIGDAYTHYDTLMHVNYKRLIDGPILTRSTRPNIATPLAGAP